MSMNMDDPRVKRTRQALRDAFVRLILVKGYDSISIQDIAHEAQSSRISFYRHYRDKEELLTDCLNTLYEELIARTGLLSPQKLLEGYTPLRILYEHIEEKEDLYRILFSSRGTQTVIERMRHHMAQNVSQTIQQFGRTPQGDIPTDIIAYHTASAQIGLAIWWLDHNKPYPPTYMAQISLWLTMTGLIETFGASGVKLPLPLLQTKDA